MSIRFRYCVYTPLGKKNYGSIQSESLDAARKKIRGQGNTIIYLKEQCTLFSWRPLSGKRLSSRVLLLFFRQISILLSSSMTLSDSLEFLAREERTSNLAMLYNDINQGLREGQSFSEILRKYPAQFPPAVRAVILAGEKSGHMNEALDELTRYLEQRYKLRETILQATLYPSLLVIVSVLVITVLMTFAVPAITEQLISSRMDIPLSTTVLINVSQFISRYISEIIILNATGILLFRVALRNVMFRLYVDTILLRLPFLGKIIADGQNGLLLITLNILIRFSVPVLDAFIMTLSAVSNSAIRKKLETACENIHEGKGICTALVSSCLFDDTTMALLRSGERSGEFQRMVQFSSELLSHETTARIGTAMKIMEPVLILGVGLVVTFIFISIMQPMLDLNNVTF